MEKRENQENQEAVEQNSPSQSPPVESEDRDLDFYIQTIEDLRRERDENYDRFLRKQAEFENYRKRVRREKEELRISSQAQVFKEMLPVLDSAEKGLQSLKQEEGSADLDAYREGYQLLVENLRRLLERFEVSRVPAAGEAFDPNLHEAVLREELEEIEEDTVVEEYRQGYQIRGRLLRPSQVKVAVPAYPTSQEESS